MYVTGHVAAINPNGISHKIYPNFTVYYIYQSFTSPFSSALTFLLMDTLTLHHIIRFYSYLALWHKGSTSPSFIWSIHSAFFPFHDKKYRCFYICILFIKFLADTYKCPILGPLVTLFRISADVSSGFQCWSGLCLIHASRGECNVHSLRSNSGATPTNLSMASITAGHFRHTLAEVKIALDCNGQSPAQKTNALPLYI